MHVYHPGFCLLVSCHFCHNLNETDHLLFGPAGAKQATCQGQTCVMATALRGPTSNESARRGQTTCTFTQCMTVKFGRLHPVKRMLTGTFTGTCPCNNLPRFLVD